MRRRLIAGACLVLAAEPNVRAVPLAVRLHIDLRSTVPDAILRGALAEAARVWAPYGVRLQQADASSQADTMADALMLTVFIDDSATSAEGDDGVGAIQFGPDGAPAPAVTVHYGRVKRLALGSDVLGIRASQWPARVRDDILGRALGRALAHEVGHFVLRWSHHAKAGLMQPSHHASALTDPDLKGFALTDVEVARLRIVTAAQAAAFASAAAAAGGNPKSTDPLAAANR